jgi:hypothetical protein
LGLHAYYTSPLAALFPLGPAEAIHNLYHYSKNRQTQTQTLKGQPTNSSSIAMAASSRAPNGVSEGSNTPASMKTKTMPLAIIGLSCRFPGEATDALRLWDMVASQRNAWLEIPADRFDKDAFYHPNSEHVGTVCIPVFLVCLLCGFVGFQRLTCTA